MLTSIRRAAATMVTAAVTLGIVALPAHAVPVVPAGFSLVEIEVGQAAYDLTDFAWLPDGGMLASGKSGKITRRTPEGIVQSLGTIPVRTAGDLGLTGIAVGPDFATNHEVYTARALDSTAGKMLRLSRWTIDVDRLVNETVLLDIPGRSDVHAMTGLQVAADGTVWVSIGDNADFVNVDARALDALNIDKPYGKLMHLDRNGGGVSTNPFYDPNARFSTRSKVYAYGFRSPFRFSLAPNGQPYLGDVGWNTWEEVDRVERGASYGWPCSEGRFQTGGYSDLAACAPTPSSSAPWFDYNHNGGEPVFGNSVTGGIVYTGTSYPTDMRGAYFFGDYASQRIWTKLEGRAIALFGTGLGGPVKFEAAPNGDISYANIYSGKVRRLTYGTGNRVPVAEIQVVGSRPDLLEVTFWSDGTYDPDGDTITYAWDFGDGTTQAGGTTATHRYLQPGTYTAKLTVTDPTGDTGSATATAVPSGFVPVITADFPVTDYAVGEIVHLKASAQDAEDGDLTASIQWFTELLHCPSTCHSHPGETYTGAEVSIPFTDHGGDTRLHVVAVAKDSSGQQAVANYTAAPRLRTLTASSNYPAAITINGAPATSAQVVVGGTVTVAAPTIASDSIATFDRWTDGQPRVRSVQMPTDGLKLAAQYITPIDRRYAADAALRALLGPSTGAEVTETGGARMHPYANGRLYWTQSQGVHEIHGAILGEYLRLGGSGKLGAPSSDEMVTPDGQGRFNHLPGTAATGAASIYWSPATGAHGIWGAIRTKWSALGWEMSFLGYPATSETITPDGQGRFNHFQGGSIYWAPGIGSFEVHGWIRDRWAALGWEAGYLGYPTSDEFAGPCGPRSNFQRGFVELCNGIITDRPY